MRTRIRDWILVGVALALVFGVSLRAPDPPYEPVSVRLERELPARMFVPDLASPRIRQRPQTAPPFERVDPARFLLYTTPALEKRR